ncbi:MAG: TrkH family potassium uptake protein [Rhizobiaceae bacterium]|nr:TrkH family potassium uptake protein [Rhizobiaceae bacterium]MCV0406394.1 TrkH family potassium uptake protein [Rhizobiaceae bacterium]
MQSLAVRYAIHISAVFALYLSGLMLIPALVDLYYDHDDWQIFAVSALLLGGFSSAVALATQSRDVVASPRFAFLLVNMLWFTFAVAGMLPLMASSFQLGFTDAFFESVSAATATGATVMSGLDTAPPGLLLWRSLLQCLGGLGVIAVGLFILPFLNIGGVSYFKIESSDIEDKPFARFATFAVSLLGIYLSLVLICAIAYAAAGMTIFNAVNHAMTTVATAGMSTHDTSFVRYTDTPAVLWIAIVFMIIGSLPFSIMILFILRGRVEALRDPQIRVFLGYAAFFSVAVAIYLRITQDVPFFEAITLSTFNFVSIITTTGYASSDYSLWGAFAVACAFVATFLGGCSGSTTGGIKAYRFLILFRLMANGLRKLIYPHAIVTVRYGDRTVDDTMQRAVVLYISSFLVIWVALIILLAATGLDLTTATSGALTALTNVGPGLGDTIGPAGNYATLPDAAKWFLAIAMLLGRLELLAVLVIFTPGFWSR